MNSRDKGLAGGSDVSVSGGSTTANVWTVDGANNNDVGSNRTILVYPSVDAIEEFKIQRNNYGAEFGQAGGAHVNLVTRGGTNEFHGSLYYYARRDEFNSIDYFLEQAGQEAAPLEVGRLRRNLRRADPQGQAPLLLFAGVEQGQEERRPRLPRPHRRPSATGTSAAPSPAAIRARRSIRSPASLSRATSSPPTGSAPAGR